MLNVQNPKATVIAKFPKAKCAMKWGKGYKITLGATAKDFNGNDITEIQTSSDNPAMAWETACFELRLV